MSLPHIGVHAGGLHRHLEKGLDISIDHSDLGSDELVDEQCNAIPKEVSFGSVGSNVCLFGFGSALKELDIIVPRSGAHVKCCWLEVCATYKRSGRVLSSSVAHACTVGDRESAPLLIHNLAEFVCL